MVVAETFGLPLEAVKVNIGSSTYPFSGASGGSTTVGAVSESHRRAAQDALTQILDLVAKKLQVEPDQLEVGSGKISVAGYSDKSVSWKEACSLIGIKPLEVTSSYKRGSKSPLSSSNVAGCQLAHVAVDTDTGVVLVKKMVAVQDIGLIINRTTAESQVYGAMIMSIAAALFEQRINDPKTGAFVNAELDDYKLPRLGDIGDLVCHFYEPESERSRGVIGLGEPPAISGAAALSNAVCNAIGVRVPSLPMTPEECARCTAKFQRIIIMKKFEYAQAATEREAVQLLNDSDKQTAVLAGGTDLVGLMKRMVVTPDRVVNIREIDSLRRIETDEDGNVWIGAAVCLDKFAEDVEYKSVPVGENDHSRRQQYSTTVTGNRRR